VANRAQTGFSFIELLVSLLIISSGVLGYAELILKIKSTQHHADERLQAILLADYVEKKQMIKSNICTKPAITGNFFSDFSNSKHPKN
jgi:prepilin-type N-terminal cleavage/methylation domain-containing protein